MPTLRQRLFALCAIALIVSSLPVWLSGPATAQEPVWGTGRYFAETGHNLRDPFLSHWEAAGGEDLLGLPISEERYVEGTGGILQTFETLVLKYDPALEGSNNVVGEKLPSSFVDELAPDRDRDSVPRCNLESGACQYFPETGHTLSGEFLAFWRQHGDGSLLGLPISEPFTPSGTDHRLQVLENAVLEENPQTAGIRLRPVGREIAEADGSASTLAFQPAPPTGGTTRLVSSPEGLRLRAAPSLSADVRAILDDAAEFITIDDPEAEWIAGYADGYSGWVATEFLTDVPPLPEIAIEDWDVAVWQGAALGETNVRSEPTTDAEIVEVLQYGSAVTVTEWVKGEEVYQGADLWARVGENKYIYARNIGRNAPVLAPPVPGDAPQQGRWLDVNLTQQLITAYEGRDPVRVIVTTTGMAGWETPPGLYQILTRVPNETMTSGAIGAEHYYKLDDVLFTQYFTNQGHAIHFAWWRTEETIGRPGSHGCLNVLLDDARFLWDWASIGTPIYVHD